MSKVRERAKALTRQLAARVRDAVEPVLPADAAPLEVQYAIVEAIENRVQPIGGGRRVQRDPALRVRVVAVDSDDFDALKLALSDLSDIVAARLRTLKCEIPQGWHIDVNVVRKRPSGWPSGQRFLVEAATTGLTPAVLPPLKLTVLRGTATKSAYLLVKEIVRIGRSEEPVDGRGRPRLNDVIFHDDGDKTNLTVGRGHCHIRFHKATGVYRVFDDKSSNGTRIVRRGESIEVRGDPQGAAILNGDELHLGKAALRVTVG